MSPQPQQLSFSVGERRIAALLWGQADRPLILAVHGWLDNAESFADLAAHLDQYRVLAIDLAGHGRSDWRHDRDYAIGGYVEDLYQVVCQLGQSPVLLLGHSLGAGVASLFAASFPQRVSRLALIENLGPLADPPEQLPARLAEVISARNAPLRHSRPRPQDAWIRARMAAHFPVPRQAAERLMRRCTQPDPDSGLFQLRSDPALLRPTLRLTEAQVVAALFALVQPVLLIRGEQGVHAELTRQRITCVEQIDVYELPGGHHLHLGALSARVAELIANFYAVSRD